MNSKPVPTPGPWVVGQYLRDEGWSLQSADLGSGDYVGEIYSKINAAFIVRACNAHDALLAALELCEGFCKGHQETPANVERYRLVRDAIAKATIE